MWLVFGIILIQLKLEDALCNWKSTMNCWLCPYSYLYKAKFISLVYKQTVSQTSGKDA